MRIGILTALAVALNIVSYLYLVTDDSAGYKKSDKFGENVNKNLRLMVYSICACVILCGLSVALVYTYSTNTLIHNMKLITLLVILVTVAATDIKKQIIPNMVILIGLVIRVGFAVAEFFVLGNAYFVILKSDLCSIALVVVLFILGVLVIKNGIGMGDIKLIFLMGIFQGITGVLSSLIFSLLASFLVAIIMLVTRKRTRKDSIEFAPLILFGTTISIFLTGM